MFASFLPESGYGSLTSVDPGNDELQPSGPQHSDSDLSGSISSSQKRNINYYS